jgi:hypothetical protein
LKLLFIANAGELQIVKTHFKSSQVVQQISVVYGNVALAWPVLWVGEELLAALGTHVRVRLACISPTLQTPTANRMTAVFGEGAEESERVQADGEMQVFSFFAICPSVGNGPSKLRQRNLFASSFKFHLFQKSFHDSVMFVVEECSQLWKLLIEVPIRRYIKVFPHASHDAQNRSSQ